MSESQYYENPQLWRSETYLSPTEQARFGELLELVPPSISSLLDVGAGNGEFLRLLEVERTQLKLRGMERSRAAIAAAVCATHLEHASIDAIPVDDRSVDLVSALEVIEHLPFRTYEAALSELSRVSGRYVLISVPYRERRSRARCPYCGCSFTPNYHMRTFDDASMSNLLPGFEAKLIRKIVTHNDYIFGSALRSLYRAVGGNGVRYPASAVCPQCGYTREARATISDSRGLVNRFRVAAKSARLALPNRPRVRWIASLYERVNDD